MKQFILMLIAFMAICFAGEKQIDPIGASHGTEINHVATIAHISIIGQDSITAIYGALAGLVEERPDLQDQSKLLTVAKSIEWPNEAHGHYLKYVSENTRDSVNKISAAEKGRCSISEKV